MRVRVEHDHLAHVGVHRRERRAAHRATGLGDGFDGGPLALPEPAVDRGPPLRGERRRAGARRRPRPRVVGAQRIVEQRHAEREQLGERGRDARTGIGVADECVEQRVGMTEVVALLAHRPGGDVAHALVGRSGELLPPQRLGRVVQPVAHERGRPLGARRLDEPARPVVGRLAAEREGVDGLGARCRTGEVGDDQLVEHRRVTELVLADRGERQVLLEERRDADPLGVALTHQVLVVGERQQHGALRRTERRHVAPVRHVSARPARRRSATTEPSL